MPCNPMWQVLMLFLIFLPPFWKGKKKPQGPPREVKEHALGLIAIVAGPDSNLGLTDSKALALALFYI